MVIRPALQVQLPPASVTLDSTVFENSQLAAWRSSPRPSPRLARRGRSGGAPWQNGAPGFKRSLHEAFGESSLRAAASLLATLEK